jgi:hypothetical protein
MTKDNECEMFTKEKAIKLHPEISPYPQENYKKENGFVLCSIGHKTDCPYGNAKHLLVYLNFPGNIGFTCTSRGLKKSPLEMQAQ